MTADQKTNPFAKGVRACAAMLEHADVDECALVSTAGRLQNNIVRTALDEILKRGDDLELQGFTAALSAIVAAADESGDWYRIMRAYAAAEQKVWRRRVGSSKAVQS